MVHGVRRLRPEQLARGVEHEAGEVGVVHGHRIAADQLDVRLGAMGRRDAFGHAADALEHALAGGLGDGANRAEQARGVGDHVARRPRLDLADGHHRRVEDVDPAGHQGLKGLHDLARDGDRVEAVMGRRGVSPLAPHLDPERIARGHGGAGARRDGAGGQAMGDVQREGGGGRRRAVEQPLLDHDAGAVVALFAGLEHEQHRAGEQVAATGEEARGPDEHCRVRIMAARVHGARHLRGEGKARLFRHRQRVHVGAQQDRGPRPRAGQSRDDRRRALSRSDVEAEAAESPEHSRLRPWQGEADFGMPVDAAAKLDRIVEDALGVGEDR